MIGVQSIEVIADLKRVVQELDCKKNYVATEKFILFTETANYFVDIFRRVFGGQRLASQLSVPFP